MIVDQLEQRYDLKVDLGNYQTGTVEFYVQAKLGAGVDVDAARSALQDMATRNVKTCAFRLRPPNGKPAPEIGLGVDFPGVTVTKLGVGFGKKLKIGNGFGVSNRDIFSRTWAQLEPRDDPAESAETLWNYAVRAYEWLYGKKSTLISNSIGKHHFFKKATTIRGFFVGFAADFSPHFVYS